jgi:hypothetical protein
MSNVTIDRIGRTKVVPYSAETRDLAFELWWLVCDRDPAKVAELLATDPLYRELAGLGPDDKGPDVETVRRWVIGSRDWTGWEEEAHERMRQFAPHMLERGAVKLVYSFNDAVNTLVRVAQGKGSGEKGQVTSADRIAADNAHRVVQMVAGNEIAALAKPKIDESVQFDKLETMADIVEAERALRG